MNEPWTVKGVLRRIAKECRENIAAFEKWEQHENVMGGLKIRGGAKGEARGTVATSKEVLQTVRAIQKDARRKKGKK